ncbi:MAG TPA: ATP-binding protein, partial [Azospirillaceae bacterium]|nr:ATP-binding protein [Azospirillaceae bacterium]
AATQRGRALAALRESESRFRGMFENSNAGIAFTGPGGRFVDANDAFLKMMRCSRGELMEKTVADFTHPDDMAEESPLFDELLRGVRREYRLVKRCLPVGGGMMWVDVSVSAVRGDDGRVRMLVGAVVDVSDLKANEAALAISNAELEQFGYVASHDLRQPLRMITSYLTLLEKRVGAELAGEPLEFLGYARSGARRMEHMLASLLEYSRIGRNGEPMSPHDSRSILEEAMRYLGPDIEVSGAVVKVSGDWPRIVASEDEMVRLFQNLLSNALKYRRPGVAPNVTVSVALESGEWLFTVADNGVGFPPDQTGRLFKVFQRLAAPDEYEGTGVGLAVCRKIVERHGGRIWGESPGKGQGAAFHFTLPTIQTGPRAS